MGFGTINRINVINNILSVILCNREWNCAGGLVKFGKKFTEGEVPS